jgi:hypothetical protein
MDWRREGEVLEQILALLVAFAGLADRAVSLPLFLQLPLFAFLTQGEAVARSFIVELPAGAPALLAASRATDRAARLAADFRALARMLRALLARARRRARFAGSGTARTAGPVSSSMPPLPPARPGRPLPALPAPDTS